MRTINLFSIVSQTIGLLLSKQWIIKWNFHTNIPECAPKFWCPKQEMYCFYTDIFSGRLYALKFTLSKVKVTLSKDKVTLRVTLSKYNFQEKVKVTSVTNSIQSKFWSLPQVVSNVVIHTSLNVCRAQEVLSLLLTVSWCA